MKYIIQSKHHSSDQWNDIQCGPFNSVHAAEKELRKEEYTMFDMDTYKFRIKEII
jgi:hypothetical protein